MLRFAEPQGLSRLDMANARAVEPTQRLLDYVGAVCRDEDVLVSQIMLGFIEAMMPDYVRRARRWSQGQLRHERR